MELKVNHNENCVALCLLEEIAVGGRCDVILILILKVVLPPSGQKT